jgi:hypothetical protein
MSAPTVELVFVLDASGSMAPCFTAVATHLADVIKPIQGAGSTLRFGLITYAVGVSDGGGKLFYLNTLNKVGLYPLLYGKSTQAPAADLFVTDVKQFQDSLEGVEIAGDENTLVALDCALDFPFGPVASTKRVVAIFSDEKIEDGSVTPSQLAMIPQLIDKIHARRIKLFAALPSSPAAEQLAEADGSEFEDVQGGDGLKGVDFGNLFRQMGKSISGASLQKSTTEKYQRGLFGQESWGSGTGARSGR